MAKKIKYIGNEPVNKYSLPSFSTFNDSYSTTIFNGGIDLSTSFSISNTIKRDKKLLITRRNVTLSDLKIYNINELNSYIKIADKLKLNIDKTNLSAHAVYGSLKEKFRITINNIINKFPGGLHINDFVSGVTYYNVLDYTYDDSTNISSFRIPINVIENPFFLNLSANKLLESRDLYNIPVRFNDYVLTYNGIIYGIEGFTGISNTNSSYLYLIIDGNPFSGNSTPQNISDRFLITPNDIEFNKFYGSLNELERYFLNRDTTPKYTFQFKIPQVNEDDELEFIDYTLNFPLAFDGYNLDTISIRYITFLDKVFEIANLYDDYKSNLIIRKFTPNSLIDFDGTDSFKTESILKIYGNKIDEIKMFFDSLMHINTVSYDKINNIPDTLIKNLARTLSWKAQNIINDKDLVKSIFKTDKTNDTDVSASLAEIDIELWRRIVNNTAFFLKSKGTRTAIETIFAFIGAPESLVDLTEHVYVVDAPIGKTFSITESDNSTGLIARPPYDENGYPAAPSPYDLEFFQVDGNEDFGQKYIDIFRKEGFAVTKTIDNKKSWVYVETATTYSSVNRNTRYKSNDSRLIINTKEIDIGIDIARAIEYDVYQFNVQFNYPVIDTGSTIPYPQRESNNFLVSGLTFAEYIDRVYSSFINAQNRKVSDSAIGSYYPSLTKLYYDYLESPLSTNKKTYRPLYDFVSNIDAIFTVFVEQFIPATTIYDGLIKIRNTEFTPQKYVYKQGIDDGSEFEGSVKDSEQLKQQNVIIIQTELFDTYEDSLSVATITTEVKSSNSGNIDTDPFAYVYRAKNIEPTWDGLVCDNENPSFNITGATKIELSSLTNNSLYNKEIGTGHTVSFNFTSGTETLSASSTVFYFNLHNYDYTPSFDGFSDTPVYTFSALSSSFTSTTEITTLISDSLLTCDTEYIIKPYFKYDVCPQEGLIFTAKTPYTMYENFVYNDYSILYNNPQTERFFDPTKFSLSTGSSVSTLLSNTEYTPLFRNYNTLSDYYFVSTCDAEKPLFTFPVSIETDGLVVETIPVNDTGFTKFNLINEPVGDIVVAANGVTLLEGLEYSADTSINIPSIRVRSFVLSEPLTSDYGDVLTVAYYKNTANNQKLIKENFQYSGSPNITSNGLNYTVNLNYGRAINNSDVVVYINGVMLTNGPDYTISVFNSQNIVLDSDVVLLDGDVISVVYFTPSLGTDVINLTGGSSYAMFWRINSLIPSNVTGNFTHQFYDLPNTGLTGNSLYSINTSYLYNTYDFSQDLTWSLTPLTPGGTYFYRIKSEKYFTTINNIGFTSTTYSDTIKVRLPV